MFGVIISKYTLAAVKYALKFIGELNIYRGINAHCDPKGRIF